MRGPRVRAGSLTELPKKYASFSLNQESSLTDTELLLGWTASEFHADAREKVGLRGIVSQVGLYVVHVEIAVACLQKNGESRAGGCVRKKVISPEQRRRAAWAVVAGQLCCGRAACRFLKVLRSTYWYRPKEPTSEEQRLLKRMRELSEKHARYGYRRIAALLRQEGWPVGKRHAQRLRRCLGLRVPPTKGKVVRRGLSTGAADEGRAPGSCLELGLHLGYHHAWRRPILTILDEYTRECHVLRADRALKSSDVLEWIGRAIAEHGSPAYLRSDNGPEFIAKEVQRWLAANQIKTIIYRAR